MILVLIEAVLMIGLLLATVLACIAVIAVVVKLVKSP